MSRELFEIWEESEGTHPVKMQLVNYVGNFETRVAAERYATAVKHFRTTGEAPKAPTKKQG